MKGIYLYRIICCKYKEINFTAIVRSNLKHRENIILTDHYMKLTFICRFIVMQNKVMKYMTRIGQNTGMLKKSKKVHTKAITVAFVAEYQNLNSGNL